MTTNQHQKVRIKIGEAEFEAEGDPSTVSRQFDHFVRLLGGAEQEAALTRESRSEPSAAKVPEAPGRSAEPKAPPSPAPTELAAEALTSADATLSRGELTPVYRIEPDGTLHLTELPPFDPLEPNVFVLVLYGNLALRGEHMVTSPSMMNSARRSGLENLERADTHLSGKYADLIVTTGTRRGKRYGLSSRGVEYAEARIRGWIAKRSAQEE
jgi:hypothetical protein